MALFSRSSKPATGKGASSVKTKPAKKVKRPRGARLKTIRTAFVATRGTAGMSPRAFRGLMKLSERPDVLEFHSVAGDDCYLFKVRTGSIGALNAFVSLLASPPFSLSTRTTIAMQTHFEKVGGVTLEGKTSNEA